jgi:hypothetical protein
MRVLLARWRWRRARLPTILAERDLLVELRAQTERTRGSSRDAGSPVAQPVRRMVRALNSAKESERDDGPKR